MRRARVLALTLALAPVPALAQEPAPAPVAPPPAGWQDPGCPEGCPPPAQPVVPVQDPAIYRARPRNASLLLRASVAAAYTNLLHRSMGSARLQLEVGADLRAPLGISGRTTLDVGGTEVGLPFQRLAFGPFLSGRLGGRVRLGAGPRLGMLIINRASSHGDPMIAFSVGAEAELAITLVGPGTRLEREQAQRTGGALELILAGNVDFVDVSNKRRSDDDRALGASLGLGYRY